MLVSVFDMATNDNNNGTAQHSTQAVQTSATVESI